MSIPLPAAVSAYMNAIDGNDGAVLPTCLADDIHVYDKGEDVHLHGPKEVERWFTGGNEVFQLRSEIKCVEADGDAVAVTAAGSGNFPTSPQAFRYRFTLSGALIREIEIVPVSCCFSVLLRCASVFEKWSFRKGAPFPAGWSPFVCVETSTRVDELSV